MDINPIASRGLETQGRALDNLASGDAQTKEASTQSLKNIISASQVSAYGETQALGDNIDISEQAKSLLNGFKDLPVSDTVKDFIQNQFDSFEDAVGGAVKMFQASVSITAGQMTAEDGSTVEYLKVSVEMFAVSTQTLAEQVETPTQADFLKEQLEAALKFAEEVLTEAARERDQEVASSIEQMYKILEETLEPRAEQ